MKKIIFIISLFFLVAIFLLFNYRWSLKPENSSNYTPEAIVSEKVFDSSYNGVMKDTLKETKFTEYYKNSQEGEIIEWDAKISAFYSQITGIKFCVVDEDHQEVDINERCDLFWAFSVDLMDADDVRINPDWDGQWVDYILRYYGVDFDKNSDYYDDIYTVKGIIKGIDCAPADRCAPDIDIISIKKK